MNAAINALQTFPYEGVIHVHSTFSDGTGSIPEIMEAATSLGLDFVIITDHNTVRGKTEGFEHYYTPSRGKRVKNAKPAMCLICYELNDAQNQNHYLSLGLDKVVRKQKSATEYVAAVKEAGGFGIIAHPHEKRGAMEKYPPYPWTAWDAKFDGIEIWNHMSEWMESLNKHNRLRHFVHPLASITAPPKETLALWDKLNLTRKVMAVGSVDAHAHKHHLFGMCVRIFPYKVCFKSIRTYAVLREPVDTSQPLETERHKIFTALREGHSFIANTYHGNPKGFLFSAAQNSTGRTFLMGDDAPSGEPLSLSIISPKPATLRLIKNGEVLVESEGEQLNFTLGRGEMQAGVYRAEAQVKGKAWIFSNAIRVGL